MPGKYTRLTPIFAPSATNRRLGCPSGRKRRQVRWYRTRHHRRHPQRHKPSRVVRKRCRCRRSTPTCHGHRCPHQARSTPPGGSHGKLPSRGTGRLRHHRPFRRRSRPACLHRVLRLQQQCPRARFPSLLRGQSTPKPRMRQPRPRGDMGGPDSPSCQWGMSVPETFSTSYA